MPVWCWLMRVGHMDFVCVFLFAINREHITFAHL